MKVTRFPVIAIILCSSIVPAGIVTATAQDRIDTEYGDRIEEFTTDTRFSNHMVDHLPASDTVPSPLEYFGTIIGDPGVLHSTTEIYAYLRAVADSSPRVSIRSIV